MPDLTAFNRSTPRFLVQANVTRAATGRAPSEIWHDEFQKPLGMCLFVRTHYYQNALLLCSTPSLPPITQPPTPHPPPHGE